MKFDEIKLTERPIIDAYRYDFSRVKGFFQYNPNDASAFFQRYKYLQRKEFHRDKLVKVLLEYNQKIGASKKTLENIAKLNLSETTVVITGQQPGVLTGPLYTIYKALTVIKLAEGLMKKGIPAIPLFWVASEDHDFHEIAGVNFLNQDHQEIEIRLQGAVNREPIGKLNLNAEVQLFLEEFSKTTFDTEFKSEIMVRAKEMAEESRNLGEWFTRIMAWLFKDTGIVFVDSLSPDLRNMGKSFFIEVLEKNSLITNHLNEAEKELNLAGFPAQVRKNDNQVHLFLIKDNQRYPLDEAGGSYILRGLNHVYSFEEICYWVNQEPGSVSTNVVTRPLFQDFIFPTVAYVSGPGETAYYAQYKKIYSLFGMEMPIIYPRVSITLIESSIAKILDKYNLTPIKVFSEYEKIREKFLNDLDDLELKNRFNHIKGLFIPEYQKLLKDLAQLDSKFKKLGTQNLKRIIEEINYLEDKAFHQHRKNSEVLLRQLDKVKANLYPGGLLQERRFNIFPFIFKYRPTIINDLLELDILTIKNHCLLYL